MNQTIQQITAGLVERLPENEQYYRPEELRKWGFPSFIVERIKIELERNLADSMMIPKSDWANNQSERVQSAWDEFVRAIHAEVRLPASYAKAVIETSTADVLELLVQPRRNLSTIIFGTDDELEYSTLKDRLKQVVVYRHFASLVLRYMQKRELDSLSKSRCDEIIKNADQMMTARYSPLNWAQMMEPLFNLLGGNIDTDILRLFFEDRKKPHIARHFDLMNDSLTRARLIEELSSTDVLNFEGYKDDQSTLFGDQPDADESTKEKHQPEVHSQTKESKQDTRPQDFADESEQEAATLQPQKPERNEEPEEDDEEHNLNTKFSTDEDVEEEPQLKEEEESTLNTVFSKPESEDSKTEDETQSKEKVEEDEEDSDSELKNADFSKPAEDQSNSEKNKEPLGEKKPKAGIQAEASGQVKNGPMKEDDISEPPAEDELENEEETPMWMRYMSEEEIEEYKKEQAAADEPEPPTLSKMDEDGYDDEPVIDLTKADASEEEQAELKELLSNDRAMFVEHIFQGSDRAFDEAVEEITGFESWKSASKYIEKDVFKRNMVDLYSEAAIDYTDRLQSYFLKK